MSEASEQKKSNPDTTNPDLSSLKENWSAPIVARQQVGIFSGGLLNPRTMSNLDSKGEGPPGRLRYGKKIAYQVDHLISWMESRIRCVDNPVA